VNLQYVIETGCLLLQEGKEWVKDAVRLYEQGFDEV
jgi:hypothetical protein